MKVLSQLGILLLAILILWISYTCNNVMSAWWTSFLQNIGAGLFSALVLIFMYDQVLDYEAKKLKDERDRIAAEPLITLLRQHIYGLLFPMYRSAVLNKPKNSIKTWKEFLTVNFPDQMKYLDISVRSPGSYPDITPYPKFISDDLLRFSNQGQDWLNKYGSVVDADLVAAMENVLNSNFIIVGRSLEQTANFVPPGFPFNYSFVKVFRFNSDMCQDYGIKLSNLIDSVERKLPSPISKFEDQYWHNECLDIGYARLDNTARSD